MLPDQTYLFRIARSHLDDRAQLDWLAAQLGIADALVRFRGIRRLVIVPHDVIANVPFAALPVGGSYRSQS